MQLLGFVDNSRLARTMAVCDVLLMPYQRSVLVSGGTLDTATWMSPLKMFEYMAMGRAIIASDLPVLREVLTDRIARMLDPDNSQAWIQALRQFEDADVRETYSRAALLLASNYDWSSRVKKMLEGLA